MRSVPAVHAFLAPAMGMCLWACAGSAPAAPPPAASFDRVTTVRLLGGIRELDDDWDPLDSHAMVGLEIDSYRYNDPLGFEFGGSYSQDDEDESAGADFVDSEVDAFELYGGARKTWHPGDGLLRPYVGAGVAYLRGEIELDGSLGGIGFSTSEDDSSLGFYGHAGIAVHLSERVSVGADLRGVFGAEFDDLDGDFLQAAGFLAMAL